MSYYTILELNPGASLDEVKKAYRRLAMKWHPDRNNNSKAAEEKFKLIKLAYEKLSDPNYVYVPEPKPEVKPQPARQYQQRNHTVVDVVPDATIEISLDQVATGVLAHASKRTICPACSGTGSKHQFPSGSIGDVVWRNKTRSYYAETKEERESDNCRACKGSGEIVDFDCFFDIPQGVEDKQVLKLVCKDRNRNPTKGRATTRNIKVRVKHHYQFTSKGNDLFMRMVVSKSDLIEGTTKILQTLNNRRLSVKIPPNLEDGTVLRLVGCGLPDLQTGEPGNLYLTLSTLF